MNEAFILVLDMVTGCLLGAFFFGGLWWTIRKAVMSKWSALWFFGSLVLRTSIVLAGFCFMALGHWERLLACLAGFIISRFVIIRMTGSDRMLTLLTQEERHAP